MSETADGYMAMARSALDGARLLLGHENADGACNRAYYAMFNAARAALVAVGADILPGTIKTHAGLIGAFGKYVVQAGHIDADWGRALNKAEQIRLVADYSSDPIAQDDATATVEMAGLFVTKIDTSLIPAMKLRP